MENSDYYQILGLTPEATSAQIKERYRKLAFEYHPDRNQDDASRSEKMKRVNEAYAVLSNPAKRKEYDALRRDYGTSGHGRFRQNYSEHDIFRGSDINAIFEDMARMYGLRGFSDIFKDFYGPSFQQFEFRRPGMHVRGFVWRGGAGFPFLSHRPQMLSGRLGRLGRFLGLLGPQGLTADGQDVFDEIEIPAQLAATGGRRHYFMKHHNREILLNIPLGIRDGQQIRLAGMGETGRAGGIAGDLYLRVKFKKPWWQHLLEWIFPARK